MRDQARYAQNGSVATVVERAIVVTVVVRTVVSAALAHETITQFRDAVAGTVFRSHRVFRAGRSHIGDVDRAGGRARTPHSVRNPDHLGPPSSAGRSPLVVAPAPALASTVIGPATADAAAVVGSGARPGSGVRSIAARASNTCPMKKS